jgi:glutathione S-transferase
MQVVLYQYPGGDGVGSISPPCLRVDLALRLLGLEFKRKDLRGPKAVQAISTTGRLPVLEIDGERFVESTRILDHLEQRFDAPWIVEDPRMASHLRLWEYAINDYFYWCGFSLRWVEPEGRERFLSALLQKADWKTRFFIRKFFIRTQEKRARIHGVGARPVDEVIHEVERGLDLIVSDLGAGPFLLERSTPSRADLTILSLYSQSGYFDSMPIVRRLIEQRPAILPYLRRVNDACGGELPRWIAEATR